MKFITSSAFDGMVEQIARGHSFIGVRLERPADRLHSTPTAFITVSGKINRPRLPSDKSRCFIRLQIFERLRALAPDAHAFYFVDENNYLDAQFDNGGGPQP